MKLQTLLACAFAALLPLAVAQKKPLDHDVYDKWETMKGSAISDDGKWIYYGRGPAVGDSEIVLRELGSDRTVKVDRGSGGRFSGDGKFFVTTVVPTKAETDKAKKDKKPAPKNTLAIVSLGSGAVTTVQNVPSFRMAEEDKGWIAYMPDKPAPEPGSTPAPKPDEKKDAPKSDKKKDHAIGKDLVLQRLGSDTKIELKDVSDYAFDKQGRVVVYARSTKDGKEDGAYRLDLENGSTIPLLVGLGRYRSLTISDRTGAIAFLSDRDDYKSDPAAAALYLWQGPGRPAEVIAKEVSRGIPEGWWISPASSISFSDSGRRVMFRTVLKPKKVEASETPDDEKVVVDIWNWQDPELQPMQIINAPQEGARTYAAMIDLASKRILQLETPELRSVSVGDHGDANVALGSTSLPYRQLVSWDQSYSDFYIIDLQTGARQKVIEKSPTGVALSPRAKYAYWYDESAKGWLVLDLRTRRTRNVTQGIGTALWDEEDDRPAAPPSYGNAGWTKDDGRFLVYDMYDVWACDPTGASPPVAVTDGYGRLSSTRFRIVRLEREQDYIDPSSPLLLSAFDRKTMAAGFYRDYLDRKAVPSKLLMDDKTFGTPTKAASAEVLMLTRSSFTEFPDLWVSNPDFVGMRKVSEINTMMKDYLWGTAELVEWTSLNGQKLRGILRKPENFDPAKTYPMIVYFYETLSETLNGFRGPGPSGGASISPSFYTSRGYIVFEPDIPYRVGYPGQSAKDAILPGVAAVIARGYVDPRRIAAHGHSWGGYQTLYLITQTDMFRCAIAGAPVSNMISAYGGIRWGPGMVRQFQYEKGQSRIGGSLWERPLQYIENSPIFWADKVNTPVLLLHNDQDDAVPWYQSIEMFTALRRLSKPAWFINYNGEFHGIRKRQNAKDWSIRMQQFFDYYLKDGPMPKWMAEGVPAVDKGKDLGLGPAKKGG